MSTWLVCAVTASFVSAQDLPLFPIQTRLLEAVKERVNLARQLDKLDLHVKKATSESGWLQKAAEDMDIVVDDVYMLTKHPYHIILTLFVTGT